MKSKILVIGATGMIGKSISKQLKSDGFSVRLLTRNAEKAHSIFGEGFEVAEADVQKRETLHSVFDGIQRVYINLPEQNIAAAVRNILEFSQKTSVEQIGYTSGCTVRKENAWHPMIRAHFEAETLIRESGIAWSIFRPTMIMDTIPAYSNKGKPFIIGNQPHGWSWIHTQDMAKMISGAFQTKDAMNRDFTIFGPDRLTIAEAVDIFNAEFYPAAKKAKPTPFWLSQLIALFVGSKLKYAISIFRYFEKHPEEGDPFEANQLLGSPQIGIKEFLNLYRETISH